MKNKNKVFLMCFLIIMFLTGCAGMFIAGVPINADEHYQEFLGIQLKTIVYPAAIINNGANTYVHMPHNKPYGKFIADVPESTIITIHHVVRKYSAKNDIFDHLEGQIDVPGYNGFVTVGICDGSMQKKLIEKCIDLTKYEIFGKS